MKSGSSSSFRAAAELPDREDESMPRSMPESPKPGERFALEHHPNSWTVYDWVPAECLACFGVGKILERDTGEPDRQCLDCRGTGTSHEEPEEFTRWLSEADARLLVFGKDLLASCEEMLRTLTCPSRQLADITREELNPWLPMLRDVIAKSQS